ncbi:MAG: trypsin-like serine protease [Alphaproteobacteria bacterium]|nr:trypsin-like serine protease [Alphaproteobacteria bacterium]
MNNRFTRYVLVWVLLLLSLFVADSLVRSLLLTGDRPRTVEPRADLAPGERHTVDLFQNSAPSVVSILSQSANSEGGTGSGFIWDAVGHVVTNYHVIEGASQIRVRLDGGDTVSARLTGVAPDHDLAVVKLATTRSALSPIPVGSSADLKVGQAVYAIGNPFGLNRSLTTGIISALDRRLPVASGREIAGVIQTDAAINPGNSGGPLLDSAGRLIGVNTAIISETGSFAGIGFAVPVDIVNRIVPALIRDGRVPRPGIGITVAPDELAARLGVNGLVVAQVVPNSPAARAGLHGLSPTTRHLADIITHVGDVATPTLSAFAREIERTGIGGKATLGVLRDGRTRTVQVEIADVGR